MTPRTYATPAAFKAALENRLRGTIGATDLTRRRQLLVFDRFLARVVGVMGEKVVLKGGLVLELRLDRARTTQDVDLRVLGRPEAILDRLQEAGRHDLGDYMRFELRPDTAHPDIRNEGMRYEGLRFRAECRLAGKIYGQPFGVDVAFGDPILGEPEILMAEDLLAFAGIPPPTLRVYPIETHIAEKLHAYTLPRARTNTRVKDLPDIALLAGAKVLDARRARQALEQTFGFRDTHPLPGRVPGPPDAWTEPYASMATDDGLAWPTLDALTEVVQAFLDPLLAGSIAAGASWQPELWAWEAT